jgi:hypothetical protein
VTYRVYYEDHSVWFEVEWRGRKLSSFGFSEWSDAVWDEIAYEVKYWDGKAAIYAAMYP